MRRGRRELRRIEHYEVETTRLVAHAAQFLEHIAFDALGLNRRVQRDVALEQFERRARAVDRGHRRGTSGQRIHGEAAGVREAIEHCALRGDLAHPQAVGALVEIKPGLVAMRNIDFKFHAGFLDHQTRPRRNSAQQADGRLHAFKRQHVRIRALKYRPRFDDCLDGGGDFVPPAHRTRARELHDDHVAVSIDDDTGQSVRFRMHEPYRIALRQEPGAQRNRARDSLPEKNGIDIPLLPVPHAGDDLRLRVVGGNREKLSIAAANFDGVAGFGLTSHFFNCARKHPRMVALERLLAAWCQYKFVHSPAVKPYGCLRPRVACGSAFLFRPWMRGIVNLGEVLKIEMRIDLRR